jgi:hypothetical protein
MTPTAPSAPLIASPLIAAPLSAAALIALGQAVAS